MKCYYGEQEDCSPTAMCRVCYYGTGAWRSDPTAASNWRALYVVFLGWLVLLSVFSTGPILWRGTPPRPGRQEPPGWPRGRPPRRPWPKGEPKEGRAGGNPAKNIGMWGGSTRGWLFSLLFALQVERPAVVPPDSRRPLGGTYQRRGVKKKKKKESPFLLYVPTCGLCRCVAWTYLRTSSRSPTTEDDLGATPFDWLPFWFSVSFCLSQVNQVKVVVTTCLHCLDASFA